jgi:hypothetical protein
MYYLNDKTYCGSNWDKKLDHLKIVWVKYSANSRGQLAGLLINTLTIIRKRISDAKICQLDFQYSGVIHLSDNDIGV